MKPIIHIGPPKTATTSLQDGVIPRLNRPFQIKPQWTSELAKAAKFQPPPSLARDVLVSDEALGEYVALPPEVIAGRLEQVFEEGVVVFVERDPLDLFYSLYRQKLINTVGVVARLTAKTGESYIPATADQHFELEVRKYRKGRFGFFAMTDLKRVRAAFSKRFDVQTIPFNLLRSDPNAFVSAFVDICGGGPQIELPHVNKADSALMGIALAREGLEAFPITCQSFQDHYNSSVLAADRADFIRNWSGTQNLEAFA